MSKAIKLILSNPSKLAAVSKVAFDAVDEDKSGYIDIKELEKILIKLALDTGADPPKPEDIEKLLKQLDENDNGCLELEEFQLLIQFILRSMIDEYE